MSKEKTQKFRFLGRYRRARDGKFTFFDRCRESAPFMFMRRRKRIREGVRKW